MYGIMLILVLVIMGGAIAYIGDKLGSKVGKKKLTVFGLRPKHTSILVTIVTGFLIAASTLAILTVASQDVRTALFGMAELKQELVALSSEVVQQNDELLTNREALAAKTQEYLEVTAKVTEQSQRLTTVSEELRTATRERERAATKLQQIQQDYAAVTNDLKAASQEIEQLTITRQQLDERIADLNTEKNDLEADVVQLTDLTDNLRRGLQVIREGAIVFRAGEVLSTTVVSAGKTRADTERTLNMVLVETNKVLLNRMEIKDNRVEALRVPQVDFNEVINVLEQSQEPYVIRLISTDNTIYGESVIGKFELFSYTQLYAKNETVFSQTLAEVDKVKAEETMLLFLKDVNAKAIARGVLADPLQGTVGAISGSQLFDAVKRLQSVRGPVTLSAITTEPIYTNGPLRIKLDVRHAK